MKIRVQILESTLPGPCPWGFASSLEVCPRGPGGPQSHRASRPRPSSRGAGRPHRSSASLYRTATIARRAQPLRCQPPARTAVTVRTHGCRDDRSLPPMTAVVAAGFTAAAAPRSLVSSSRAWGGCGTRMGPPNRITRDHFIAYCVSGSARGAARRGGLGRGGTARLPRRLAAAARRGAMSHGGADRAQRSRRPGAGPTPVPRAMPRSTAHHIDLRVARYTGSGKQPASKSMAYPLCLSVK